MEDCCERAVELDAVDAVQRDVVVMMGEEEEGVADEVAERTGGRSSMSAAILIAIDESCVAFSWRDTEQRCCLVSG